MIERLKFFLFTLHNISFRDGDYVKSTTPYFNTILMMVILEVFLLFLLLSFYNTGVFLLTGPVSQLKNFSSALPIFIILMALNYFILTKAKLDRLYTLYSGRAKEREKKYKMLIIIIYMGAPIALGAFAWFSQTYFKK